MLYLGGNAGLYVLVNPCNDDSVELVSVGATRLVVIDEVTCSRPYMSRVLKTPIWTG